MNVYKRSVLLTLLALLFVAACSQRSSAQNVFLPIVTGEANGVPSPEPSPEPEDGAARIAAAGEFAIAPVAPPGPTSNEVMTDTLAVESGPLQSITCTTQEWSASDVRRLSDRTALGVDVGIVYPGALVQGMDFESGGFTPITIPRAGGTIVMEGITLEPGASYSRDLEVVSPANVQNAIKDILGDYIEGGTTANYGDDFRQTYSYEHMLFTLGLDARYGIGSMEADLSIDTEKTTNYLFYKFQQKFYDVVFEAPEQATSVFRDGAAFAEPDPASPQIAAGNPPLYVHKVSYGRIVYFVAESQYSAQDVEATLRAAVDGGSFEGSLQSGLTHEQVMDQTRITTFVLGGNAGDAVQNVKAGSAEARFAAIRNFVGSYGNANFSPTNPGAPIAYELRYLKNRQVARMSYTTVYDQKDCVSNLEFPPSTPVDRDMWIRFRDVNKEVELYHGQSKLVERDEDDSEDALFYVNNWISGSDGNEVFTMKLNPGAGDGSIRLEIFVDDTEGEPDFVKTHYCERVWPTWCPDKEWDYTVNVRSGTWVNR